MDLSKLSQVELVKLAQDKGIDVPVKAGKAVIKALLTTDRIDPVVDSSPDETADETVVKPSVKAEVFQSVSYEGPAYEKLLAFLPHLTFVSNVKTNGNAVTFDVPKLTGGGWLKYQESDFAFVGFYLAGLAVNLEKIGLSVPLSTNREEAWLDIRQACYKGLDASIKARGARLHNKSTVAKYILGELVRGTVSQSQAAADLTEF